MSWIWTVLSAVTFLCLLQKLFGPKNRRNLPPGPRGLPILGHFHLLSKNPHKDLFHLARKHGPMMGLRFGLVPTIVVSSVTGAELILKTHDHIFANRPRMEAARQNIYAQRDLIFGQYGPYWRNMRKLCSVQLLSNVKINQFERMRKVEIVNFVRSIKQSAERGESVDLSAGISAVIGDMNCFMILGRRYDDSEFGEEGFKKIFMEAMEVAAEFNLADYFPYVGVLDLQGLNRRMKRLSSVFDAFLEKIVTDHVEKKRGNVKFDDFVDIMMSIMESGEAEFEFDHRHIKADLLIAGMDTSATAIEWAMSELMRHPVVMKKVQQEVESVVGLDKMVEESHLDKLKYLDCVVKETMRLRPVAPLLVPHESMEDCELEGFHIPKRSRIIVNVWAIGRDPNLWFDPESFKPERFIGSDIDLRGHHFELVPFGSGRRGCPGLQLGLILMKVVLAQLLHCFEWKLPDGMLPCDVDMSEHFGVVTSRAKHLQVISTYRLATCE